MITKLYLTLFLLLCLVTTQAFAADSLPLPAVVAAQEIAVPVLPTVTVELNGRQITVEIENPANPLVVLTTTRGDLLLELFPNEAPETVANFLGLAEGTKLFTDPVTGQQAIRPFYDGLTFHRVIDGFMIQGGCPMGNGMGGPGYKFADEFGPGLKHTNDGLLSMANSGPNTNGSQFFITLAPTPWLDNKHAIFGEVTEGIDIVRAIGKVKTGSQDRPAKEIVVKSVTIEKS